MCYTHQRPPQCPQHWRQWQRLQCYITATKITTHHPYPDLLSSPHIEISTNCHCTQVPHTTIVCRTSRDSTSATISVQNGLHKAKLATMTMTKTMMTMTTTGVVGLVQEWWRGMAEGRAGLWDKENAAGMHGEERGYEREGGMKVGPPTSNGHSNSRVPLGVNYPPMDTSNDTETTAIWPLTPLPLPPPPDTNIGPYRLPQAQWTPLLHVSPIVDMGDHGYQAHFSPQHCQHHPRWWQCPILIPAAFPALYQPYDHHQAPTPIFNSRESDGGLHFPSWCNHNAPLCCQCLPSPPSHPQCMPPPHICGLAYIQHRGAWCYALHVCTISPTIPITVDDILTPILPIFGFCIVAQPWFCRCFLIQMGRGTVKASMHSYARYHICYPPCSPSHANRFIFVFICILIFYLIFNIKNPNLWKEKSTSKRVALNPTNFGGGTSVSHWEWVQIYFVMLIQISPAHKVSGRACNGLKYTQSMPRSMLAKMVCGSALWIWQSMTGCKLIGGVALARLASSSVDALGFCG